MLKMPQPMTSAPKSHIAGKYYEFHKQNGHTTAECRELRKAPHELANKVQIDQFLKKGLQFLQKKREPARPKPCDEEYSTEINTTIASGYVEGITRSAWKAQLWET